MRIDAYNQVAQLYGIQKNLKTQKAQNAAGPRDQVSISQAGRDYQVAKSAVSEASDIREGGVRRRGGGCGAGGGEHIPLSLAILPANYLKSIMPDEKGRRERFLKWLV